LASSVFKIKGVVQHYAWGGTSYIPGILHVPNEASKPFAEYWLGAHPNHPSQTGNADLHTLLESEPALLGEEVAREFGSLPFLLKVLDVRQMLSIQVHPSKASAEEGFAAENAQGIPMSASNRNYKDNNHKPELMAALSNFWLLHGFKESNSLRMMLEAVPELQWLLPVFESGSYRQLYETVMALPQEEVNRRLEPLAKRLVPLYEKEQLSKDSEDFWAARAFLHFCTGDHFDRGIFSIYLFNLVHLKKGEGIYQGAGLPHAYLEGQNVELMANSDNVLRAGLTDKHIDIAELLKHVRFEATIPEIIRDKGEAHQAYLTPAKEFELHQYRGEGQRQGIETTVPEIWLCLGGEAKIRSGSLEDTLQKGEALFVAPGSKVELTTGSTSQVFRATVPLKTK
jgi:mannose-6-phosphate isomerase